MEQDKSHQFFLLLYHQQEIIKANIIPHDLINQNDAFYQDDWLHSAKGSTHIAGIDLVRTSEKEFLVLEEMLERPQESLT